MLVLLSGTVNRPKTHFLMFLMLIVAVVAFFQAEMHDNVLIWVGNRVAIINDSIQTNYNVRASLVSRFAMAFCCFPWNLSNFLQIPQKIIKFAVDSIENCRRFYEISNFP